MFKATALLLAATAAVASATSLPFQVGTPIVFGSGCPEGSVALVPSTDGSTLSVLFSEFDASTSPSSNREYSACSLAVNLDVNKGFSVAVSKVDYRGNVYVPNVVGSHADFSAEYFFAGARGPQVKNKYAENTDENIMVTNTIDTLVYSACGASTNFRINAAVTAYRPANSTADVQIAIDTVDTVTRGFNYRFTSKPC